MDEGKRIAELERVLQNLLECFGDDVLGVQVETEDGLAFVNEDLQEAYDLAMDVLNRSIHTETEDDIV